jgi:hypothetical protein
MVAVVIGVLVLAGMVAGLVAFIVHRITKD